jgi:hypothetical protein
MSESGTETPQVVTADTVTKLGPEHRDQVLIGASHGGIYAGYLAAKAGVRAVILNDAGIGKDQAGIGSLGYLDELGLPAATVDNTTARIADAEDMARRGEIRHVNEAAGALGCEPGMSAMACAECMLAAAPFTGAAPVYEESRFLFRDIPGEPQVWGVDSASLLRPEDAGQIVFTASHGALLGGKPDSAISVPVLACAFNDAGVGIDDIGISRLPVLDQRGIAAVTVDVRTARIGDVRSSWESGRISYFNEAAARLGMELGKSLADFAEAVIRDHLAGSE